uniref:Phosphatase and actin regulator n=1 Tax=Mola mola TaxID=94237 RepID=A0A3Q3WNV4_MOLML
MLCLTVPFPLSAPRCLTFEPRPPCFCSLTVLQLCLQQRRTREQLVEQGIMPPLKTPAAFHERIRSLERARTGNFLKHKLCSRPQRAELVRLHILQETQAEPSLQATQMKLKRARLADDLNEKIAQRPGPMELVEKNILPVDSASEEVLHVNHSKPPTTPDIYSFDEDSSDALSPQQPSSQQSPSSISASPRESGGNAPPKMNSPMQINHGDQISSRWSSVVYLHAPFFVPCVPQQSLPKLPSDRSRSKRSKEPKPRVKKLKYHQYIPPDQKQELNEMPMDLAYARLLQQQQQFLQLQILSQQQYSYQSAPPATAKYDCI